MKISEICIKRPVFATVVNLLLILLGIVCYDRLSVREYPNIDVPVVTVDTNYPGASAEIMESQITKPLEDSLSGIEGIDFIRSISRSERSQITVEFKLDRDPDAAASDVRDRVGRVRGVLPEEIDEPIVAKVEADAQPIMWIAISSDTKSALEVSDFADRIVQDRLQTLTGVANIRIFAARRYAMRLWLDRERMAAQGVTASDIEFAVRRQNVEIPAGRLENINREFTVLAETDLKTPEEFGAIIIKKAANGYLVRVRDVARVELGAEDDRQMARYNQKSAVAIGVVKQSTANPLDVSREVRKAIPQIELIKPEGIDINVSFDSSVFIQESINGVYRTIVEAVILVSLVIFFFLRSVRASIIPLITIPISLIATFSLMYVMGFTVNTLTLLAMVLAIGLVVDDAIVVLENIYRHIEEGMKPIAAAIKGIREIGFAVIAMTLTLAAVFAPVAFTEGRTGKLFIEFALTLAGAVLVSGFTALTLTPVMCSRILKRESEHDRGWKAFAKQFLDSLTMLYKALLTKALGFKYVIVGIALITAAISFALLKSLPSELSPVEDRGVIYGIIIAPEGATIDYTNESALKMEEIFRSVPETAWNFTAIGFPVVNQAFSPLGFKDWSERERSTVEISRELAGKLGAGVTGSLAFPVTPPSLGQRATSRPVDFIIQSSGSYAELQKIVESIQAKVQGNPAIINMDSDLKLNKPEIRLKVNREKLAQAGVEVSEVGRTLETMLGSKKVTRFKLDGEQYEVMLQVEDAERMTPSQLSGIFVRATNGKMVQLRNLLDMEETVAPRELNHFNKLRAVTLSANIGAGHSLGEALTILEDAAREASNEIQIDYGGVSREFKMSSASLFITFMLALGFIYLVLAAQFESYIDPLIIMFSVPLAMAGALIALKLTGGSLNVYSQIGLVTLVGLITKHGIMIVEFANQLQQQGRSIIEAAIESSSIRFRPILMTTLAMVLGAIPLALASGAGAETREQIGWVIVGGMTLGTFLTLFVVPAFYILLARNHQQEADIYSVSSFI